MFIDFVFCPPFYADLSSWKSKQEVIFFGLKKESRLPITTTESGSELSSMRGVLECRKRVDEDQSSLVGELVYLGKFPDTKNGGEYEHYSVGLNVDKEQFDKLFHCVSTGIVPSRVRISFPWKLIDNESFGIRFEDVPDCELMAGNVFRVGPQ